MGRIVRAALAKARIRLARVMMPTNLLPRRTGTRLTLAHSIVRTISSSVACSETVCSSSHLRPCGRGYVHTRRQGRPPAPRNAALFAVYLDVDQGLSPEDRVRRSIVILTRARRPMVKKLISAAAIGLLGLTAATFGSAQAAIKNLGTAVLAHPFETNVIHAQERKTGRAARSSGPRRTGSSGRSSVTRRAGPSRRPTVTQRARPGRRAISRAAPRRSSQSHRYSRDGRHRFYGSYFAVPFGFALYANHYCYDWDYGSRGWGYYWNYERCPLW